MALFRLISEGGPWKIALSVLLSILSGISYASLIPVILFVLARHQTVAFQQTNPAQLPLSNYLGKANSEALFITLCIAILLCRSISQIIIARAALNATARLRVNAYRRIMGAPIADLERIGPSKLLVAITTDVQRIIMGATTIPNVLIALVTLGSMCAYIFVLNASTFWLIMTTLAGGLSTYQTAISIGNKYYKRARIHTDTLQEAIRGLLYGTKELKLSTSKQDRYLNEILMTSEEQILRNSKLANTIVLAAANYGDLLNFIVIGIIIFIFTVHNLISSDRLSGTVMMLLYIAGPVAMILNAMPQIINARISLKTSTELFAMLPQERTPKVTFPLEACDSVTLRHMSYRYKDSGTSFELGPLSVVMSRGELTFVVGGNGSGKSTLGKLIALHYSPTNGAIYFGRLKITPESLNQGRQHISAIFNDFYLFDRLLTSHEHTASCQINQYLQKLGLEKKVRIEAGKFSTLALSDGEKKRLALLVTFLEDRDVYIFDEWASDQDPAFKRIFYHEILHELKKRNKIVVVISHDDRYFHLADKLLIMEDGKLLETKTISP